MANVKSNAADYINKLYDETQNKQKQMLTDAYNVTNKTLDAEKQNVQQQTDNNLQRTNVEAQRVSQQYKPAPMSSAASQQAALTMENQQKKNTQMLQSQQQAADAEYERLRKLYADQFSAEIKKAQADNDMARAEQLYAAAKAKENELRSFSQQMGALDNQALIDQIYNNATESGKQELEMQRAEKLSELAAQQEAQRKQTDANLTQTYVNALRQNQNAAEYQNARGLGSGNVAQSRLARDTAATDALTQLRRAQMASDANIGAQKVGAQKSYGDSVTDLSAENERKRAQAMYAEALTQMPKPVYVEDSYTPLRGGTGKEAYVPPKETVTYNDVARDIENAKINGNYGGSVQAMINAAYKEGYISKSEKKKLEKGRNALIYVG